METPLLSQQIVIFDTNAYRMLFKELSTVESKEKISRLVACENSEGYQAFLSPIVLLELLNHMKDDYSSSHFKNCLSAIVGCQIHCGDLHQEPHNNNNLEFYNLRLNMLPDDYIQLYSFNRISGKYQPLMESIVNLSRDIFINEKASVSYHKGNGNFDIVSSWVNNGEKKFIDIINELVSGLSDITTNEYKATHPNADLRVTKEYVSNWFNETELDIVFVMSSILRVKDELGLEYIEATLLHEKASFIKDMFPCSAHFISYIVKRVYLDSIDLYSIKSKLKRWNWFWDYLISYSISPLGIAGRDTILVTGDDDIHTVAKNVGYSNSCIRLDEYLAKVNFTG